MDKKKYYTIVECNSNGALEQVVNELAEKYNLVAQGSPFVYESFWYQAMVSRTFYFEEKK